MSTSSSTFTATAPGRLCLFGEHQDYLNLPVIALSLPLYCRIRVQPHVIVPKAGAPLSSSRILTIRFAALQQVWTYDLDNLPPRQQGGSTSDADFQPDFALAAIYEALDDGWVFPGGADCESSTEIPLQAGCSSSSAFCVAWSLVIAKLCGKEQQLVADPIRLAQRAHRAEVTHFGAPGGTMDHVTSALGGLVRIGPDPWQVQRLPLLSDNIGCWVLADSGEPKDTFKHLHRCKNARLELLKKLGGNWDVDTLSLDLSDDERVLLAVTITNRDMEAQAAQAWFDGSATGESLAAKMLQHHEALRDGLHLSTPKLEALSTAAMRAGAFGFKVVGSGGGGCGVAWTQRDSGGKVAKAMRDAGAPRTWIVQEPSGCAQLLL